MFGFLRQKDLAAGLAGLEETLAGRLGELEEGARRAERLTRRSLAALETLAEEQRLQGAALERLSARAPGREALLALAESLALWRLASPPGAEMDVLAAKLDALLAEFGLKLIAETGRDFDPDLHQACDVREDPDRPDNTVLEVVRPGFLADGRVLRWASVVVNRRPESGGDDV